MNVRNLLNLLGDRLYQLPLLVLYLTDGCNSRCVSCDIWRSPRRNMSPALVEALLANAERIGLREVLLSGGEAMQHPEWSQIASRFRDVGVRVMLLTNGLLLKRQADRLAGAVDEVIVSLDGGCAATYDTIRGVDAFDLVLDGIRAARDLGLPVITRTTIQRANFREMRLIVRAAKSAGVNKVSFLAADVASSDAFGPRFGDASAFDATEIALTADDIPTLEAELVALEHECAEDFASGLIAESPEKLRRTLLRYFAAPHGLDEYPPPPCNAPHFSAVVDVDGALRPCYFLPAVGRMRPDAPELLDHLNQAPGRDMRRAYRQGQRAECARCVCPLYRSPRALVRS